MYIPVLSNISFVPTTNPSAYLADEDLGYKEIDTVCSSFSRNLLHVDYYLAATARFESSHFLNLQTQILIDTFKVIPRLFDHNPSICQKPF